MYQNCCKKCGSISLHTEVKGNNTGLYCDDCGAWIKWLGKDELQKHILSWSPMRTIRLLWMSYLWQRIWLQSIAAITINRSRNTSDMWESSLQDSFLDYLDMKYRNMSIWITMHPLMLHRICLKRISLWDMVEKVLILAILK